MNVNRVENLRAWQLTYKFKLAVYRLIRESRIAHDLDLRRQIRTSAASAVSQIEEGFARFYPKDNGRMVAGARASLKECLGHLRDAVDLEYITEDTLVEKEALARPALREIAGYLDYLQSEEAELNARRTKEARIERRRKRSRNVGPNQEQGTENREQGTESGAQGTEYRTRNRKPGTRNKEPGIVSVLHRWRVPSALRRSSARG